ncbi:hypothetical protein ACTSKR_11265 [Chitinibacteraceae bacterium HSL-7]
MSFNPYKRLALLLGRAALDVGTVSAVGSDGVVVTLVSGAEVKARGDAAVGARVWVRDGVIEGPAPALTVEEFEV